MKSKNEVESEEHKVHISGVLGAQGAVIFNADGNINFVNLLICDNNEDNPVTLELLALAVVNTLTEMFLTPNSKDEIN